jgi:hypothetical protein
MQPSRLLWADDGCLAEIAKGVHKVRRVWSQVVLAAAAETGLLPWGEFNVASARLVAFRYAFTWWNLDIFEVGARLSGWNPNHPMFERFLDALASKNIEFAFRAGHAAGAIRAAFKAGIEQRRRDHIVVRILNQLALTEDIASCGVCVIHVLRTMAGKTEPVLFKSARDVVLCWYSFQKAWHFVEEVQDRLVYRR